jgi:probable DNA metabolism protein
MIIFRYDKTFDGLLTTVFDAFNRKTYPDLLLGTDEPEPLFTDECFTVITQADKAKRVWQGLMRKTMPITRNMLKYAWLSELPGSDGTIFRYVRKTFDTSHSIEMNFADEDVLEMRNLAKKVDKERLRLIQFVRFQKSADDIYFAPVSPLLNALPIAIEHFTDRFADQKWIIYDTKRNYGYYYDLKTVVEMTLDMSQNFIEGKLNEQLMAEDEKLFQDLWKGYFTSMTIKERINPKLHRQNLPVRYWKYLTEKQ